MGTRSITNVVDESGAYYVSLYRQYDGYPLGGHGEELAEFLQDAHIGNGIGANIPAGFFNGVGDLACRLVAHFKDNASDIGSFYLQPPSEDNREEFTYTVFASNPIYTLRDGKAPDGQVTVLVESYDKTLFQGTTEEFSVWVAKSEDDEEDF